MTKRILVLGAYGNFGKRICKSLSIRTDICLLIAGRSKEKAEQFCNELKSNNSRCELVAIEIDISSLDFAERLGDLSPDIVVHTSGPFQGQAYQVPMACIKVGSHYIDLADDRRFVCDFHSLDASAQTGNVLAICGASSVPGLSSTVIESYKNDFALLEEIDISIVPGNKAVLGIATLQGILSYIGRPFKRWQNGKFVDVHGWMDNRQSYFGEKLGQRWLANVDIPDLELFPHFYKGVKTVRFQAGLELPSLHRIVALMAQLTKWGLIRQWDRFARPIFRLRSLFLPFGTGNGGMRIILKGKDSSGEKLRITWLLVAENNVGPYIPIIPAIILINKLIDEDIQQRGAMPCLALFSKDEFAEIAEKWGIYQIEDKAYE